MNYVTFNLLEETEPDTEVTGFGALGSPHGNLPLCQLGYRTSVVGLAVSTILQQTFYNPFDEVIEATYIFPLQCDQAVIGCKMIVGDRVTIAELKERGKARAEYRRAIRDGYRAALLEENRSETFSMKVGNIPPGEAIVVQIETVGRLAVAHGEWTLRLPLVVAPRYTSGLSLPGGSMPAGQGTTTDTDIVPDASAVTPPVLLPGFKNPVHLSVIVDLDLEALSTADEWVTSISSSLHSVGITRGKICHVEMRPGERVNRDFILRGRLADSSITASLTVAASPIGNDGPATFSIDIVPPPPDGSTPRDVVFLLDRSGSMSGWKMDAARRGVSRLIDSLCDQDRFVLAVFDDCVDLPFGKFVAATDANRYHATRWLAKIDSRGGTEMAMALRESLAHFESSQATHPRDSSLVLVTDGQITGEDSVLAALQRLPSERRPRIYGLGVDRAVNGSVLSRLTKFTGGTYELVESEKRLDEVLKRFASEVGAPAITELQVRVLNDADGRSADLELAPSNLTTLHAGRPTSIFGRVKYDESLQLEISGKLASGARWTQTLVASDCHDVVATKLIRAMCGKARIRQWEDEYATASRPSAELAKRIVACSLDTGILSRFTAMVAVDRSEQIAQGQMPHQVLQPVEMPAGWQPTRLPSDYLLPIPKHPASLGRSISFNLPDRFDDLILSRGIVSLDQMSEAQAYASMNGIHVGDALVTFQYATDEEVAQVIAQASQLQYINLYNATIDEHIVELIPESVARENNIMPIGSTTAALTIGIANPADFEMIEKLRFILNRTIHAVVASASAIQACINRHYGQFEGESADSMLQEFTDTAIDFTETEEFDDECVDRSEELLSDEGGMPSDGAIVYEDDGPIQYSMEMFAPMPSSPPRMFQRAKATPSGSPMGDAPVVRLINLMLAEAVQLRATHLFLDLEADRVTISYLISGKRQLRDTPPARLFVAMVSRIKILAKLDLALTQSHQQGVIAMTVGSTSIAAIAHVGKLPDGTTTILIEMQPATPVTISPQFDPEVVQWLARIEV